MSDHEAKPSTGDKLAARRRDRRKGLGIIIAAFLAAIAISWKAKSIANPGEAPAPEPPTSERVQGFPKAVDVLGNLDRAQELTERRQIRGLVADGVKSDGTVDVTQTNSKIKYVFGSRRGEGPQPARPPGTVLRSDYCGRQKVMVTKDGLFAKTDEPRHSCRRHKKALPTPRCGPKDVWQYAMQKKGAKPEHTAKLEYFNAKAGPSWRFSIRGTSINFVLYGDCQRELKGKESFGSVP